VRLPVLCLALLLGGAAVADEPAAEIAWLDEPAAALEAAVAAGKPVFVDVWAVWCAPCRELERTTYRDAGVVAASAGFVPLKVDGDLRQSFVERHAVEVYPTLLFLDEWGDEIARLRGAPETPLLLERLGAVAAGYASYREAVQAADDPARAEALADYLVAAGNPAGAAERLKRGLRQAPAERRDALELRLAGIQLDAGELRPASKLYERLAQSERAEVRGAALVGLVRAERERGRDKQAASALARLSAEFPELAAGLAP